MIQHVIMVALGGGIGSVTRYLVSLWAVERWGSEFPFGTLLVNIAGCFIIGAFMVCVTERIIANPYWRLLTVTGFLGGLTTFSSFSYETLKLLEDGQLQWAVYNVLINVVCGLAATWLGIIAARWFV